MNNELGEKYEYTLGNSVAVCIEIFDKSETQQFNNPIVFSWVNMLLIYRHIMKNFDLKIGIAIVV